jgi:hypothetical protein
MDVIPKNQFVSLDILEKYIEKHPEDAEKWLEFIQDPAEQYTGKLRRRYPGDVDTTSDLYKTSEDLHTVESDVPIEHYNDGCLFCKKSWVSTDGVPTTTLICGHKFHTVCSMIDQYNNDMSRCIVDDCDINTWDYVRKIVRSKERVKDRAENILLDAYQKRSDFKKDLKELKENISVVSTTHSAVGSMIINAKKDIVHKHLYTINQIQNDINENVKLIKESEQMHKYKQSVRVYRKRANQIFRKYHLSFRELHQRGIIRAPWRVRWVLERHRTSFSYYKMGLRMYPGKKTWKDSLEQDIDVQEDTLDMSPAMLRAGLDRLEEEENI